MIDNIREAFLSMDRSQEIRAGKFSQAPIFSKHLSKQKLRDTPIELAQELLAEAKTLGNRVSASPRTTKDFAVRPLKKFVRHLRPKMDQSRSFSTCVNGVRFSSVSRKSHRSLNWKAGSEPLTSRKPWTPSQGQLDCLTKDCWQEATP